MMTMQFKRRLKAQAHALNPVVMIGQKGITENALLEVNNALETHELIKVKISAETREEKYAIAETICSHCRAHLIQIIGHVAIIYRKREEAK